MEVEDVGLTHTDDTKMLRKVYAEAAQQATLSSILTKLKQIVINTPQWKDKLPNLINFFMLCQSNHKPSSPTDWQCVFEREVAKLEKVISAEVYRKKQLKRVCFKYLKDFNHHSQAKLSLAECALTLKTQPLSEKVLNFSHIEDIKTTTKLKSLAFFAWLKYLSLKKEQKHEQEQQLANFKRAHEFHTVTLKFRAFYACKKYILCRQEQREKSQLMQRHNTAHVKRHYFQQIIDAYTITKIEEILSKKVAGLSTKIAKKRFVQKLKTNVRQSRNHNGYNNYRSVIFIKYMIESHCSKKLTYDEKVLPTILNACNKTSKNNIIKQMQQFSKIIKQKAFRALKNRKNAIKNVKTKANQRTLSTFYNLFKGEIKYQTILYSHIGDLHNIIKKYHFRRTIQNLQKVPIRRNQANQQQQNTNQAIIPIQLRTFFIMLRNRHEINRQEQQTVREVIKNDSVILKAQTVRKIKCWLQQNKTLKQKTEQIKWGIKQQRLSKLLFCLREAMEQRKEQLKRGQIAAKHYFKKLKMKKYSIWKAETAISKSVQNRVFALQLLLQSKATADFLKYWHQEHVNNKKCKKMLTMLNIKKSKTYFKAILKFNIQERQTIRVAPVVHFGKIKQDVMAAFKNYISLQRDQNKKMKKHYQKIIRRRAFQGIVKNKKITDGMIKIKEHLEKKKKFDFFQKISEAVQRQRDQMEKTRRLILFKGFRNLMSRVYEQVRFEQTQNKIQDTIITRQKSEALQAFIENSQNEIVVSTQFSKVQTKLRKIVLKNWVSKISQQLKSKKQHKSLMSLMMKREMASAKLLCRYARKHLPKLIKIKNCQKRLTNIVRTRFIKNFIRLFKNKHEKHLSHNCKIAPIIKFYKKQKMSRVFYGLLQRSQNCKKLVKCLVKNIENTYYRAYSTAMLDIFEEYSFKSRCLAVQSFVKKCAFVRLNQAATHQANLKLRQFRAIKFYAFTLSRKAMTSLIVNNNERENSVGYTIDSQNKRLTPGKLDSSAQNTLKEFVRKESARMERGRSRRASNYLR